MKYDKLIKDLRYCGTHDCDGEAEELIGCMAMRSDRDCRNCNSALQLDAADAIEELLGVIQRQKEMINATAYLPLYQKPMKWIPVAERLPENQHPVLVYVPPYTDGEEESVGYVGMAYFTHWANGGFWCGTDGNVYGAIGIIHEPSYWMPLPELRC